MTVIFHHLKKCGGTSLREILKKNLKNVVLKGHKRIKNKKKNEFIP